MTTAYIFPNSLLLTEEHLCDGRESLRVQGCNKRGFAPPPVNSNYTNFRKNEPAHA